MARSFRRTPIRSFTAAGARAGAMREFKNTTHRKLRAALRHALVHADDETIELLDPRTPYAVIERWRAPDDGLLYFGKDPQPQYLRK